MPTYSRLTDRSIVSGLNINDIFHVVVTGDTTQSPQGSSFYAPISFLTPLFSGTGYVNTVENYTNGSFFLNFVDSNNSTPSAETIYTTSGFTFNPSTNILRINGRIRNGNGTLAQPSFSFNNDIQSGMYLISTFNVGFSSKGRRVFSIDNNQDFYLGNGDLSNGGNFVFKNGDYGLTVNTATALLSTFQVPNDSVVTVHAYIAGGEQTGSGGVGGDMVGVFMNNAGTVSQIGVTNINLQENVGGALFNFYIFGDNVSVEVQGAPATTINWGSKLFYIPQSFSI